jgi:hypothetical protein
VGRSLEEEGRPRCEPFVVWWLFTNKRLGDAVEFP